MENSGSSILIKIISVSLLSIIPFFASSQKDTNKSNNFFPNIIGTIRIDSLNNYAINLGKNNPQLRMDIGQKAYKLSKKENYELGLQQSLNNIGASFFHQSKFDSALAYYKAAYKYAVDLNNYALLVKSSTNIGQTFSNMYQFDSANVYYNKGIDKALIIKDSLALGNLFNSIGLVYWKKGEFLNTIKYSKLGLEINRAIGNNKRAARALNNIGSSHWNMKNNLLALKYYLEASKIQKHYLKENSPITLNNVALLYLELNDLELAEKYIDLALKSAKAKNSMLGEGYSHLNLGDLNFKKEKYSAALNSFNKALLFYKKTDDRNGVAKLLNKIGEAYLALDNFELAEESFLKAFEISKANRLKLTQTESLTNLCRIKISTGKYEEAKGDLEKAYILAKEGNFSRSKLEIYRLQMEVEKRLKNYKAAMLFFEEYETLNNKLTIENDLRILTDSKEKYEAQLKEKKNRELEHINKIQMLELKSKKSREVDIIAASIITFFLLLYLIYLNIHRKKRNASLAKVNNVVKKINKKLNDTNKLLEASNSAKDKFFSIISHDLKNPFNVLLGASELLNTDDGEMTKDERKELISIIYNDSKKLFSLLENLLHWANTQTGHIHANKVELPLHSLVEDIVSLYKSTANSKNIELKIEIDREYIVVFDEFMLSTIIRNLLSNAIKFSHNNGKIFFVAYEKNGKIVLEIEDNGVGIDEKNLKELFDESKDSKTIGTNNEKGTGLGLMICHDFAKENNATLTVESELEKGTTFKLTLERVMPIWDST